MNIKSRWEIDLAQFNASMEKARARVRSDAAEMKRETAGVGQSLAGGFAGLGKLGVAGAAAGIGLWVAKQGKEAMEYSDDLADLALKLNENTETLQRVDFAAQQTASVGVDQLSAAMMRLEKNLGDVENVRAAEALERYGLTAEKLMAMPLDQKVLAFAEAFQAARRGGSGYADLLDLLGKSAGELVPMLTQSREALEGLFDAAHVVPDAAVQRLAEMNDKVDGLKMTMKSAIAEVVGITAALADFWKVAAKSGSFEMAFDADLEKRIDSLNRATEMDLARKEQAAAMQEAQDAAARAKETEERQKNSDGLAEKAARAGERLEETRLKSLPEALRLTALEAKLEGLAEKMLERTGLEGEGRAGLEKMLEMYRNTPGDHARGREAAYAEALQEFLKMEGEATQIRDKQAAELEGLRSEVERGAVQLLSPKEQGELLISRLNASLGIDIQGAADVARGLEALRAEAKAAAASGDAERERVALARLREGQENAASLAALGTVSDGNGAATGFQPSGEVARAVNLLFGRSAENPVLDEAKVQTGILQRVETVLKEIRDRPAGGDVFSDF